MSVAENAVNTVADQTTDVVNDVIAPSSNGLDVVNDVIVYAITKDPNKSGKLGFSEYKEGNAVYEAVNPKEGVEPTLELVQTINVSIPTIHTLAGISIAVPDEDEAISIFNKGAAQKLTTKLRAYFHETDEAGNLLHTDETSFDASQFLAEPMKRRSMSDLQKAIRDIKGITPAVFAEALKAMGIIL
jgi:hypothetical protein